MNARDETTYRLALAKGFLEEAEQDLTLERWRSTVDNAQLVVENAGKAVLTLFGVTAKTHDPARQIAAVLRDQTGLPASIQALLKQLLPDLLALGATEHFMTDYGDEATYTLPWDLFTKDAAEKALAAAKRSLQVAESTIKAMRSWQDQSADNPPHSSDD